MAREKKPIELRTVDDQPGVPLPVPRLGDEAQPVRLIPENLDSRATPAARLEVPNLEALDTRRSHQPGVEVLFESEETSTPEPEEGWSLTAARREPMPWGWFALVGLALAGALIWSLTHVREAEPMVAEEHQQAAAATKESIETDRAMERVIEAMESRVKAFCQAASVAEMLPLVRDPERVGPLMERYYGQTPLKALGYKKVRDFQGAMVGGDSDFWMFTVVTGDGRPRHILLEQERSGKIAVDWETMVIYQPMDWDEYARQRPQGTTMDFRVYLEPDHFFTHEFGDAKRWASFRLTTLGGEETLFGYTPRGGEVESALLTLLEKNEHVRIEVILRLSLPTGTQSRRGVIIEKVMSPRWIYLKPPGSGP